MAAGLQARLAEPSPSPNGVAALCSPAWPLPPRSAAIHGWPEITTAFALGALLYQVAQPYIPDFGSHHHDHEHPETLDKVGTAHGSASMTPLCCRPFPSRLTPGFWPRL